MKKSVIIIKKGVSRVINSFIYKYYTYIYKMEFISFNSLFLQPTECERDHKCEHEIDSFVSHHDPFYGERDIEKGTFWYDPKANTCVDTSDRGGQCTNKRMVGQLVCRYHYLEGR